LTGSTGIIKAAHESRSEPGAIARDFDVSHFQPRGNPTRTFSARSSVTAHHHATVFAMLYRDMTTLLSVGVLTDSELLAQVVAFAQRERDATADLIATLAELDVRRLYLGAGYSSLFTYCTHVLHLSEHAAYGRIEAARAARRFPTILGRMAEGALTLSAVCLLAPVLTEENHLELLGAAQHKSKREVEQLVARMRPQPAVPSSVRKLPASRSGERVDLVAGPTVIEDWNINTHRAEPGPRRSGGAMPPPASSPVRPTVVEPLAPERYKVQFDMSREAHDKLRRAQDLLRHTIPTGDPAAIFERALTLLIEDLEKRKLAATSRPRPRPSSSADSRHVPASVRREVWARDEGRCAFVGTNGRCAERGFLELHHVVPFAAGGETTTENIELRCRAHNAYEARLYFGPPMVREEAAWFYT
jgi:hypothetical protein